MKPGDTLVVEARELDAILDSLRRRGHTLVGPTRARRRHRPRRDRRGGRPAARAGRRAGRRAATACARATTAPSSATRSAPTPGSATCTPPAVVRWRARREKRGFVAEADTAPPPRYAFVGVRPCELAAIRVQDRVFLGGPFVDPAYRSRREPAFVLAVNCGSPAGTCFCVSLGTGPKTGAGLRPRADRAHRRRPPRASWSRSGSERGARGARAASTTAAPSRATSRRRSRSRRRPRRAWAARSTPRASRSCSTGATRTRTGTRWRSAASPARNCTMVCPTCFCATVEDVTDLAGAGTERRRIWDSCFTQDFSYVHGGSVRTSGGARYRQWITHKLATWHDQFGVSGCVGCGRCITWCPVGIDITAEARAVRQGEAQGSRP